MSINPFRDETSGPVVKGALVVLAIMAGLLFWVSSGILTGTRQTVELRDGQPTPITKCEYLTIMGSVRVDPVVDATTGAGLCPSHPPSK